MLAEDAALGPDGTRRAHGDWGGGNTPEGIDAQNEWLEKVAAEKRAAAPAPLSEAVALRQGGPSYQTLLHTLAALSRDVEIEAAKSRPSKQRLREAVGRADRRLG